MDNDIDKPVVDISNVSATPQAAERLAANNIDIQILIQRHAHGDWGDVDEWNSYLNELALLQKYGRVTSVYTLPDGSKVGVVTEFNKILTTILTEELLE